MERLWNASANRRMEHVVFQARAGRFRGADHSGGALATSDPLPRDFPPLLRPDAFLREVGELTAIGNSLNKIRKMKKTIHDVPDGIL